ncbi:MAG: zonular occludens toxin domain-containing protein [Proteobacteria bacterium]|nr:zonular occludens toxin domain-containing protein [Pseudomonadota bacterium]MBU1686302.1 zonular occludens toxin domain-containing protein [Pseudomonadota bacterium]
MAIVFFTGTPGSGKTYEAVEKIIGQLRKKRPVYTNIDGMELSEHQEALRVMSGLNHIEFADLFFHLGFDREVIENFWDHCPLRNSLIVIDECQKFFGNRDWDKQKNKDLGDWASTHRHEGYNLLIITQDAERVDKAVRSLTEWNHVYRKVNFFGSAVNNKYLCYSYAGESTSGQPLTKHVKSYNNKIFRCYKSYVSADIKEQSFMKHVNVLKHPIFFVIPVVFCLSLYLFSRSSLGTGDFFGTAKAQARSMEIIEKSKNKSLPVLPIQTASGQPSPADPSELPLSDQNGAGQVIIKEPETVRIKLNYVEHSKPGQRPVYRIAFNGQIYDLSTFPYQVSFNYGIMYADIPADLLTDPNG